MTSPHPHIRRPSTAHLAALALSVPLALAPVRAQRPDDVLDQLVSTDRSFAAAAAKTDLVEALTTMFADSVVMPLPGGLFARTREEARTSLAANPANRGARITWRPIRAAVSADGDHGFTAGYMTLKTDSGTTPLKYLAYWVRGANGWRVAAYKRARATGEPPSDPVAFLAPGAMLPASDPRARAQHIRTLISVERQFSDSAQKVGLGPAFAVFGRDDALNMGPPSSAGFVVGAGEISKVVGGGPPGSPSPVSWSADFALAASSGDLGVTFGLIRRNDPSSGAPPAAFFTIWARPGGTGEWRYIAE